MDIVNEIFKKTKADFSKLLAYGFNKNEKYYSYSRILNDNKFRLDLVITEQENIDCKIIDLDFNEEYLNIKTNSSGAFITKLREECKSILLDIKDKCFISNPFSFDQANRINDLIYLHYNVSPEFLWDKFPSYGVYRNKLTKKWFGIIMLIDKYKLTKSEHTNIEVLNVKLDESLVKELLNKNGFCKAYHMNSKTWITIILNEIVDDQEIMKLIDLSHKNSSKK